MSEVMKSEKMKGADWKDKTFTSAEQAKIVDKLITARVGLLLRHRFLKTALEG